MLGLALVLCGAHALAPVTPATLRRSKVRIRGFFDDLRDNFDSGRVESPSPPPPPPPPMQAFLAGASPQAKREYAALQDAFPVGAS